MQFSNPDENIRELGLRPGEKVVIFGSGAGGHTLAAARAMRGSGTIYGIDSRGHMVEKLKQEAGQMHHMNVRAMAGAVDRLGGSGVQAFTTDVVIIPDTFFSHENKPAIMHEADRILKPGGRLLIVDWKASFRGAGPQDEHVFTENAALELAKKSGFVFDRKFSAGSYHYALIFHKPRPDEKKTSTVSPRLT